METADGGLRITKRVDGRERAGTIEVRLEIAAEEDVGVVFELIETLPGSVAVADVSAESASADVDWRRDDDRHGLVVAGRVTAGRPVTVRYSVPGADGVVAATLRRPPLVVQSRTMLVFGVGPGEVGSSIETIESSVAEGERVDRSLEDRLVPGGSPPSGDADTVEDVRDQVRSVEEAIERIEARLDGGGTSARDRRGAPDPERAALAEVSRALRAVVDTDRRRRERMAAILRPPDAPEGESKS